MSLLSKEITEQVEQELSDLSGPVKLVAFTKGSECQFCAETRQLVEEVAALSGRIDVEVYDLDADAEKATELGVDKAPAIAVVGGEDYGVRFYGIPSGYEFVSLLHAIRLVSSGEAGLSEETNEVLDGLDGPVHLQVFVTPTCPYCQNAVMLAHRLAAASSLVRADMVEATEFPDLATRYRVMGVPRTVINETTHIEGAVPEAVVVGKLVEALSAAQEA